MESGLSGGDGSALERGEDGWEVEGMDICIGRIVEQLSTLAEKEPFSMMEGFKQTI